MKLYTLYSSSHDFLKDEWFNPAQFDDYEIIFQRTDQVCLDAKFAAAGFNAMMFKKVELILDAIETNWGRVFTYADIDVHFYRPSKDILLRLMSDRDMLIQRDSPYGTLCAGFFACRANEKTQQLWMRIKERMLQDPNVHDQEALNQELIFNSRFHTSSIGKCIYWKACKAISYLEKVKLGRVAPYHLNPFIKNCFGVKWSYLPKEFFSAGIASREIWSIGDELNIPKDIILHHANWTSGVANKVAQLHYVAEKVKNRNISRLLGLW